MKYICPDCDHNDVCEYAGKMHAIFEAIKSCKLHNGSLATKDAYPVDISLYCYFFERNRDRCPLEEITECNDAPKQEIVKCGDCVYYSCIDMLCIRPTEVAGVFTLENEWCKYGKRREK